MKNMKRLSALILATVMCFSVTDVIPAKAATTLENNGINWFAGQNGNPWSGSNWTFHTGKDGVFEKMTNYIASDSTTASIKPGWAADADAVTAYIGTWRQQATQEKWAVTAFDIAEDGNIVGSSGQTLKTNGAGTGDVMVVLKNTDGFCPVWPTMGEWTWQTVADTTGITVDFTTGYKSGDTLYYIVKPSENEELTRIEICPKLTFVGGTSTDYPTTFTAFGGDKNPSVEQEEIVEINENIGWAVQQSQQPAGGTNWTFEYFDVETEKFQQLETHVSDATPNYWKDTTGAVEIKGWEQLATNKKYTAVVVNADTKGTITLTNNTTVSARFADGQFMIVQKSNGKYHILLDWTTIPKEQSVTLPNIETYVEAGDIVYYVYRSTNNTSSLITITPEVTYRKGAPDTNKQYPTEWVDEFPYHGTGEFTGMTLNLDGTISFNFYVGKEHTLSSNAYATFVLPMGGIQRVNITDAVETSNGLKFTCSVPAKEMADTVVATLYNGREMIDTKSVSVRDYAEVILKNETNLESYTAAGPLVQAMINYGAYAQKLFNYNVQDLANINYADEDTVTSVGISELAGFAKGEQRLEGFGTLTGASLVLKSETTLKLFFAFEDGISLDDLTFTIDEATQDYARSGNYYVVDIPNISADNLNKEYTVTVTAGDKTFNANCRVMTFCYSVLKNSTDEDLKNVAKALYLYNKEADVYFKQYNTAEVNRALFYGVCYCAYEAATWYGRDVEAEIQAMEEIGATSTRVWMRSSHMMNDPKTIDSNAVATMKEIITDAQGRGIQVIGMNCDWFNGTDDHMAVPERNLDAGSAYMQFLADYEETWYQLANAFPEIDTWEIGNEWNEDRFLHPLDYKINGATFAESEQVAIATDMLYYASAGIHRANPKAQTVMGGLVDVYEDGYGDAKKFLEMIYQNIISGQWPSQDPDDYFQIAAWHPYNHSGAPDATWVQRQKDIYQVILDYEGHDKVVLFTEIGLSDYGNAETDAGQKDDLITTLTLIRDELPFVQSAHWFRMFDEANAESWGGAFETGFGLFTEPDEDGNFELKAKGEAYREMTGGK